jgi:anti-anti-sigma factor
VQAISSAKALAATTGQRLDPNQELIGQGLANIVGSMSQSYAVSGSFSRSALNLSAGARTGMASVFTSSIVVVALLFLTPLLHHLPRSVLAAIIILAVCSLIHVKGLVYAWHAQRYDGFTGGVTFLSTLFFAPHLEVGVLIGIGLSLGIYLVRTMRPNLALLSLYMDGTYQDSERFGLGQCRHIAVIRFDGSLFFANVNYLEDKILELVSEMPELRHVIIVGNGINRLDASGEEMLYSLVNRLRAAGYQFSITGLNDSVKEVMRRTHLYDTIGEDHFYRNMALAMDAIHEKVHQETEERACPLLMVVFKGLPVSAKSKKRPLILKGDDSHKPHDE